MEQSAVDAPNTANSIEITTTTAVPTLTAVEAILRIVPVDYADWYEIWGLDSGANNFVNFELNNAGAIYLNSLNLPFETYIEQNITTGSYARPIWLCMRVSAGVVTSYYQLDGGTFQVGPTTTFSTPFTPNTMYWVSNPRYAATFNGQCRYEFLSVRNSLSSLDDVKQQFKTRTPIHPIPSYRFYNPCNVGDRFHINYSGAGHMARTGVPRSVPATLRYPSVPRVWQMAVPTAAGTQEVAANTIDTAESVSNPTVTPGAVSVAANSIDSAEAFGTDVIVLYLVPSSITTEEAFGTPTLTVGAVTVEPSSITSAEAFGTAVLTMGIVPDSITTSEAFGAPQLNLTLTANSITTAESVPTDHVVAFTPQTVTADSITTAEAFGTAQLNMAIYPDSVATAEDFGNPQVDGGAGGGVGSNVMVRRRRRGLFGRRQ